jgi:hypothetical protein
MRPRLVAAVTGCILVSAAVVAFSVDSRPVLAGSNKVATFYPVAGVEAGQVYCQPLPPVPSGVNRLRMVVFSERRNPTIRADMIGPTQQISGEKQITKPGKLVIRLGGRTRAARDETVCLSNLGDGGVLLMGENKLLGPDAKHPNRREGSFVSIVYLRPGSSSLVALRGRIRRWFDYAQVGVFGRWTIWAAALMFLAACTMALWWALERGGEER